LRLDFIKCIIPKSRTLKHFLTFLPDAYLATKIPDMSGKNLAYGNPILVSVQGVQGWAKLGPHFQFILNLN